VTAAVAPPDGRTRLGTYLRAERVPRVHQAVALTALTIIAISRSPYALFHGRFYAEEGSIYFPHMRNGSVWFVAKSVGYVYAFLNIATSLATHVPVERAPLVTAWLSLALVIGGAWAALALPSDLLPNAGARLAAAVLLVVGPLAVPVVWLNATNAQVYLGVLAVLFLFVDVARLGRVQFPIVAVMLVLAGLSGLYAAALTPLFIALALRDRSSRRIVLAVIVSACAVIQVVVVQHSHASGDLAQGRGSFRGFGAITRDVAAWHFGTFLFGNSVATHVFRYAHNLERIALIGLGAFVIAVVLAALLASVPRKRVAALLVAAFVLEEVLVLFGTRRGAGGRYAVVPVAILVLAAVHVAATARYKAAAGIAAALCACALVAGLATFWTGQPRTLRCIDCPNWQDQVHAWRAGRTTELRIWPYGGAVRWAVHLRRVHPTPGGPGFTPPSRPDSVPVARRYTGREIAATRRSPRPGWVTDESGGNGAAPSNGSSFPRGGAAPPHPPGERG
jgi:hypothetical protein